MRRIAGVLTAVSLGMLAAPADAQRVSVPVPLVRNVASLERGTIEGAVQDEHGQPVPGAVISAVGPSTTTAVSDRSGKYVIGSLLPGPYLVRAHLSGFYSSKPQLVDVRPSARTSSPVSLHHAAVSSSTGDSYPVLAAGVGPDVPALPAPSGAEEAGPSGPSDADDGEVAWRLRHARRSILKDATIEPAMAAAAPDGGIGAATWGALGSPTTAATSAHGGGFFPSIPVYGQVDLLTAGSFYTPQQVFETDGFSRSIAYLSLGSSVGSSADWTVRAALSQGDTGSWIVAGSYASRSPERYTYDVGMSYAAQYLDGIKPQNFGSVAAARAAGEVYGFVTMAVLPAVSITYGGRYARYDYLLGGGLLSPRVMVNFAPSGSRFRVSSLLSRRALAPGAEEFVPPAESEASLPPQRMFSSLQRELPMQVERIQHVDVKIERDVASSSTVSLRTFRQRIDNQLVTMFGLGTDEQSIDRGHYFVGNSGDLDTFGWSLGVRTVVAGRLHGSVEYTLTRANWNRAGDPYLSVVAPSAIRAETERIHDLLTSLQTDIPETLTHVVVVYRLSSARPLSVKSGDAPGPDSRIDLQVRQPLPFMAVASARWEALFALRDFFRDGVDDQSSYDELLVIRPPKRILGGLTMRF
jgi:hypothetical protein